MYGDFEFPWWVIVLVIFWTFMVSFAIEALLGFILTYVLLSGSRARRLSLSLLGALGGGAVNFLIIPPPMVFSSP